MARVYVGTYWVSKDPRDDGRTVKVIDRLDPQGTAVNPYVRVENTGTGKVTTVREDEMTKRFTERIDPV